MAAAGVEQTTINFATVTLPEWKTVGFGGEHTAEIKVHITKGKPDKSFIIFIRLDYGGWVQIPICNLTKMSYESSPKDSITGTIIGNVSPGKFKITPIKSKKIEQYGHRIKNVLHLINTFNWIKSEQITCDDKAKELQAKLAQIKSGDGSGGGDGDERELTLEERLANLKKGGYKKRKTNKKRRRTNKSKKSRKSRKRVHRVKRRNTRNTRKHKRRHHRRR